MTAGRYELDADRSGVPLGRFVYGKSYLARANAVEIDPVELKLAPRLYETILLNGVFGALRDAAPDYWGRLVIERALIRGALGEMDYLLQSADDRAGALGFGLNEKPPAPMRQFNKTLDLERLQSIAAGNPQGQESSARSGSRAGAKAPAPSALRWVARVQRLWSRMTKGYGSPSSTGPATVGIVRVSSMLCSACQGMRDLGSR